MGKRGPAVALVALLTAASLALFASQQEWLWLLLLIGILAAATIGELAREIMRMPLRRRPTDFSLLDEVVEHIVKKVVTPGRILFNPPTEMRQGDRERVEVAIARSRELDDRLRASLYGAAGQLEDLSTSPVMTVLLRGSAFDVTPLDPSEQLVAPVARWEFDVLPLHAGRRVLQLCVCMSIGLPGRSDKKIAVPVFERDIHVRIDPIYGTRQFITRHWQWIAATLIGLGSAIAAWTQLIRGGP